MDLQINMILLLIGCLFYYLAYKSPRTDIILYFFSGVIFLIGGIAGVIGYGGFTEGNSFTYTITENGINTIINVDNSPNYIDNSLLNKSLSILEILLAMYMFGVVATFNQKDLKKDDD